MDKRETAEQNLYQKELEKDKAENRQYDDYVEENGVKFRVPYKKVAEVLFTNIKKEELIDTEHSARLQYRLMLLDSILFAKVEFVARKIKITYNPEWAENRKEKISLQQLADFLAKEGVHVDLQQGEKRDVDYYNEIYKYHYNPPSIREHAPYGYTLAEWKEMKAEYGTKQVEKGIADKEKFQEWQYNYLLTHPELAKEMGVKIDADEQKEQGLLDKLFKKKKQDEKDKGFWFHGV